MADHSADRMLTSANCAAIHAQSLSLHERIALQRRSGMQFQPDGRADALLAQWRVLVAAGDIDRFERRLSWDGYSSRQVLNLLGIPKLSVDLPEPRWLPMLADATRLAHRIQASQGLPSLEFLAQGARIPFAHLLVPFVLLASERVRQRIARHWSRIPDAAQAALQCHLLVDLSRVAAPALLESFDRLRFSRTTGNDIAITRMAETPPNLLYTEFVRQHLASALVPFLTEHAVVGRLLATRALFWVDSVIELLVRLSLDHRDIQDYIFCGRSIGPLAGIRLGLGDSHNHGRTVALLWFANGDACVYKPRSVDGEETLTKTVDWMNRKGLEPRLRKLKVLSRRGYGWMEATVPNPCTSSDELHAYHLRCGSLLALVHLLQGSDCHYENVIASGPYPYLVDCETILAPQLQDIHDPDDTAAHVASVTRLATSVLQTGFLPDWTIDPRGLARDNSGFGSSRVHDQSDGSIWKHVNTDLMRIAPSSRDGRRSDSGAAQSSGCQTCIEDYEVEVIAGYCAAYGIMQGYGGCSDEHDVPLANIDEAVVRVIARPTALYGRLLHGSLLGNRSRYGIDRSIYLDQLAQAFILRRERPRTWPLCQEEHEALHVGDIPYFSVKAGGNALWTVRGVVDSMEVAQTGVERLRFALNRLSEDDLSWQCSCISASLASTRARYAERQVSIARQPVPAPRGERIQDAQLASAAAEIATGLRASAIIGRDGSASWIGMEYDTVGSVFQLRELSPSRLYGGAPGVCVFLAAMRHTTGDRAWGDLALAGVMPLRRLIRERADSLLREPLGGFVGLGGMIYSLVYIAGILENSDLLEDALALLPLFTEERVECDEDYDLVGGSAGAILALRALFQQTSDPRVLEVVARCARHLVNSAVDVGTDAVRWSQDDHAGNMGIAHGTTGIALGLMAAWRILDQRNFRVYAEQALRFQAHGAHAAYLAGGTWCRGAPGIGLAHVALAELRGTADEGAIDMAVKQMLAVQPRAHHLCCGGMGLVEGLLEIGWHRGDERLVQSARCRAGDILADASSRGGYALHPGLPPTVQVPGLMRGVAGIGDTLLRCVAHEQKWPCVLTLSGSPFGRTD